MAPSDASDIIPEDFGLPFGELSEDIHFVTTCNNIMEHLNRFQVVADKVATLKQNYEQLPRNQQIEVDLFSMYAANTLWWINLRLQGVDLTNHPIKQEFKRIKSIMMRWKEVKDRKLRPKMNIEAAQRFIRGGLYDHKKLNKDQPPNKKIRFEDND